MRISMIAAAVAVACSMTGCAVQKTLVATGGSKSDGVVRMSYDIQQFEVPKIDWDAARRVAAQRCAVWGYSDAEPFGGQTLSCTAHGSYGCIAGTMTVEYQCTGEAQKVNAPKSDGFGGASRWADAAEKAGGG